MVVLCLFFIFLTIFPFSALFFALRSHIFRSSRVDISSFFSASKSVVTHFPYFSSFVSFTLTFRRTTRAVWVSLELSRVKNRKNFLCMLRDGKWNVIKRKFNICSVTLSVEQTYRILISRNEHQRHSLQRINYTKLLLFHAKINLKFIVKALIGKYSLAIRQLKNS